MPVVVIVVLVDVRRCLLLQSRLKKTKGYLGLSSGMVPVRSGRDLIQKGARFRVPGWSSGLGQCDLVKRPGPWRIVEVEFRFGFRSSQVKT